MGTTSEFCEPAPIVSTSTACRFAAIQICEKRSSIARLMRPIRASIVDSGTPATAILFAAGQAPFLATARFWQGMPVSGISASR